MNRPPSDQPERLLAADATDFERRLLQAAVENRPSRTATSRMAKALGVTAALGVTTGAVKTLAASAAASEAAAGTSVVWPWVSAGVIGLVVAGAVVGTRMRQVPPPPPRATPAAATAAVTAPAPPEPPPGVLMPEPSAAIETRPSPPAPSRRSRPATTGELADQIAFIDAAREALAKGADRAALELLRRYQDKYPAGSFRPEATALKVETLVKLGQQSEARALAERFVAEHRGSLLAARVAALAGLSP
jgi:hypothetical protein